MAGLILDTCDDILVLRGKPMYKVPIKIPSKIVTRRRILRSFDLKRH